MYQNHIDQNYNPETMREVFDSARSIVRYQTDRQWFYHITARFQLHRAVYDAMRHARPRDWHQLLLEWPHVAETDAARLAYTRDERAGRDDKQTITSVGKYLTRHFPTLPDHIVRDLVALHASDGYRMITDIDSMIEHIQRGPRSCMQMTNVHSENHPYRVYDPALGWALAVRVNGQGETVGRCLVWSSIEDPSDKRFVRSYRRNDDGYSYTDEGLEAWLRSQGFRHASHWEGASFLYIPGHPFVAPYLDGDIKGASWSPGDTEVHIDEEGDYTCNRTDCIPEGGEERRDCEDCCEMEAADDGLWVGFHEDRWVCRHCAESYVYAYGRRGNQYYVAECDVVVVGYDNYHDEYLSDNNIVELNNGDYVNETDAVYIESSGEYVHVESDLYVLDTDGVPQWRGECVELADGEWCRQDEAWQCAESLDWYKADDDEYVLIDGQTYHPDSQTAQEHAEQTTEE